MAVDHRYLVCLCCNPLAANSTHSDHELVGSFTDDCILGISRQPLVKVWHLLHADGQTLGQMSQHHV